MMSEYATSLPLFWGHGEADPLVKFAMGEASVQYLTSQAGVTKTTKDGPLKGLSFNSYPGVGHSTNMQELDDLRMWIKRVIPAEE